MAGDWRLMFPQLADKDWLVAAYVTDGLSSNTIAARVGCSQHTVRRAMSEHGIPARPPVRPQQHPQLWDVEWLHQKYTVEHVNTVQLAAEIGCSSKAVSKALVRAGIPVRRSGPEPTDPVTRLVAQHRRPTRLAPILKPQTPDPRQALVIRGDYGWVDPDPEDRALFVVQPEATFKDLARELVRWFTPDDALHLDEFWVRDDGKATRISSRRPSPSTGPLIGSGRSYWCDDRYGYYDDDPRPGDSCYGGPSRDRTVTAVMGVHYAGWWRFDFGTTLWVSLRAVGAVPADPTKPAVDPR